MKISDITAYLIKLEREEFTGQVQVNFHRGNVCARVNKKEIVNVTEPIKI